MREEFYATRNCHIYMENILKMIQKKEPVHQYVVKCVSDNKIKVNDYIRHPFNKKNCWVPLIYALMLFDYYSDTVRFLLSKGADILMQPDTELDNIEPLIFVAHSLYLSYLINHFKKDTSSQDPTFSVSSIIKNNIVKKSKAAQWKRMDILYKNGFIRDDHIRQLFKERDLIYEILSEMIKYLLYCYNIKQDIIDKTKETDETVLKFTDTTKLLLSWGHKVSSKSLNFCVKFYLFEFLQLPEFNSLLHDSNSLIFHEDMDPVIVAVHRPLLNDYRYYETKKLFS
jgi:hypothetical protein